MKVDSGKLKAAGMVAAVIAVVGVTLVMANSSVTGGLTKGVSADLGDLATGRVTVLSQEIYDGAVAKLRSYSELSGDKTAQDKIVSDVVKMLEDAVK